ncbi:MAG: alpha/beta hydrolase [Dehalococcoidia bacterium]|nr:alpha/beta hydrolase [Dehalococcoidia bacterium]
MIDSSFVQTGDVRLEYFERGCGPEIIVLVHGYISSGRIWSLTQDRIDPARYHTIAFNNRGAGDSERRGGEDAYTIEAFAADLSAAVAALGLPRFTLVGHSLGGATAARFALDHPERLKALVLLDPVPLDGIPLEPGWREQVLARAQAGVHPLAPDPHAGGTPPDGAPSEFFRLLQADMARVSPERLLGGRRSMGEVRLRARLRELTMPVLVVAGDQDATVGVEPILTDYLALPPASRALHVFHGVGHSPNVDATDGFVEVIERFMEGATGHH